MDVATLRALCAAPPKTLDEMRPGRGKRSLILYVSMPGCTRCADFEGNYKDEFERKRFPGYYILEWKCNHRRRKSLAMDAKVDDLPAYVIIPPKKRISVVVPDV